MILPQTIQRACQLAMSAPRGPVFVSVPTEYMITSWSASRRIAVAAPIDPRSATRRSPRMAEALKSAKRPVIVTEERGRDPAAVDALVALAEALGAPVFEAGSRTTRISRATIRSMAACSSKTLPPALKEADFVLLVESVLPWHPPAAIVDKKVLVLGEDPLHPRLPYWGFRADSSAARRT